MRPIVLLAFACVASVACVDEPDLPDDAPVVALGTGNMIIQGAGLHVNRASPSSGWCTDDDCHGGNCVGGLPWGAALDAADGQQSITLVDVADGDYHVAVSPSADTSAGMLVRMFTSGSLFGEWILDAPEPGTQWRVTTLRFVGGVPRAGGVESVETLPGACF
jgi:hypothetical protein